MSLSVHHWLIYGVTIFVVVVVVLIPLQVNNRWVSSTARLYVKVKFMYSKIVPLRNRIYALQDRKRSVEKEMTLIQIGGAN